MWFETIMIALGRLGKTGNGNDVFLNQDVQVFFSKSGKYLDT